jgi:hypothetical protein
LKTTGRGYQIYGLLLVIHLFSTLAPFAPTLYVAGFIYARRSDQADPTSMKVQLSQYFLASEEVSIAGARTYSVDVQWLG